MRYAISSCSNREAMHAALNDLFHFARAELAQGGLNGAPAAELRMRSPEKFLCLVTVFPHPQREGGDARQAFSSGAVSRAQAAASLVAGSRNDAIAKSGAFRFRCGYGEHVVKSVEAEVKLSLGDGLPRVFAIRAQLHQVLINLITNACHALCNGRQQVKLSTLLEEDGSAVRVEVADTGVGIQQLDRVHVFEPFFTTKKDGKGTGLGLSIVKNIVEGYGGTVSFESRVGAGTTFHVRLPISGAPPQDGSKAKEQRG